jgi:hypothetical protein
MSKMLLVRLAIVLTSAVLFTLALCEPALRLRITNCQPKNATCIATAQQHSDERMESGLDELFSGLFFGPFVLNFAGWANPLL